MMLISKYIFKSFINEDNMLIKKILRAEWVDGRLRAVNYSPQLQKRDFIQTDVAP